jgi:hypothetical protein
VSRHPAYPTCSDQAREADAADRDLADLATLRELRAVVAAALTVASRSDRIHHPDRRWTTADLLEALIGQLADIDDTTALIRRSPLVLEDA